MNQVREGRKLEQVAKKYLQEKGYILLEENHYERSGEIDLIMQDGEFTVFVEVKSVLENSEFSIFDRLSPAKKKHLKRAINKWLFINNCQDCVWRVDFIGIIVNRGLYKVEHISFIDV